jgi:flagellar basal body-associated protein FliL
MDYINEAQPYAWKLKWLMAQAFHVSMDTAAIICFIAAIIILVCPYMAYLVWAFQHWSNDNAYSQNPNRSLTG